jgi:DNA-binding YbaB/EbfC family protein
MKGNLDLSSLMKQAQQMQGDMQKVQAELKERVIEAEAGGGTVKVMANGAGELVAVKLNEEVVDPEDIETLEDLIMIAANNALKEAKEMADAEMGKITGGMGLPGMM